MERCRVNAGELGRDVWGEERESGGRSEGQEDAEQGSGKEERSC